MNGPKGGEEEEEEEEKGYAQSAAAALHQTPIQVLTGVTAP